jgi:two-component system, NtrC family, sensor histidine kinase PilS
MAGIFAVLSLLSEPDWPFGQDHALIFRTAAFAYLVASASFVLTIRLRKPGFRHQLSLHIFTDIVLITAMANASGGIPGGLGLLLLVPLASAGLVEQGRLALLYASMASVAMLGMHSMRILNWQAQPQDYLQTALLCMSFFAVASLAHILARRIMASEQAALEKSRELALIHRIHALATGDSTDGVLALDRAGHIIYCNPQAGKLLGQAGIQPGLDLAQISPTLLEYLGAWKNQTGPASALLPDGLVLARFLPLDDPAQTLVLLEDPARAEALAQQVKLAALGRLTLNVAHEIRNPLSAISHAAQLLGEEASSAPMRKLTDIIQNNVYRLDRMVQDILTLNRRDRQAQETLELMAFVHIWLEEWRQAEEIPENAVIIEMDSPVSVNFAPQHLYQILWNLARNAWRHCRKQAGSIRLSVKMEAGVARLEICDDGTGIDAKGLSRLFEPFHTTAQHGTGLGLYIARELANANQAGLDFAGNQPGACFRLSIPVQSSAGQTC